VKANTSAAFYIKQEQYKEFRKQIKRNIEASNKSGVVTVLTYANHCSQGSQNQLQKIERNCYLH
jgi:quinol monooxygenase YgiN